MGLSELLNSLRAELNALERELKIEIPKKIEAARGLGDLRESGEYETIKDRQGFVQARITLLKQRIATLSSIDPRGIPRDRIGFGSLVHLVDGERGEERVVKLVVPEEADGGQGWVSIASPLGRGLMGRREGEEVRIKTPSGDRAYTIRKVITLHDQEFSA